MPRGQIKTGAAVSCTDKLHILHDYWAYDDIFPCPIKLFTALDKSEDVLPLGKGYLHVPAVNRQDFVAVWCFYSPHITSSLISENDIMKTAIDYINNFFSQVLSKFFPSGHETGKCSFVYTRKMLHQQDIIVHGVVILDQCYAHPLLLPDLSIDHPMANIHNFSAFTIATDPVFQRECGGFLPKRASSLFTVAN